MTDDQGAQIIALLEELIEEQRTLRRVLTEPPPEVEAPCTHPVDERTDQNPAARFWKCKTCSYIYDSEKEP